jgi:hypothetical protein
MPRSEEAVGLIKREVYSTDIRILYDPTTNNGVLTWHPMKYMSIDGIFVGKEPEPPFNTPFSEIIPMMINIVDPITQQELTISGAAVISIFKKVFEEQYDRENEPVLTPPEEPESVGPTDVIQPDSEEGVPLPTA